MSTDSKNDDVLSEGGDSLDGTTSTLVGTFGQPQAAEQDGSSGYYIPWQGRGLSLPRQECGIRNWLQTVGLQPSEDYMLDPRVRTLRMGLGWDKGTDIDASVLLLDANVNLVETVWFRKLVSSCGSVVHSGDNLTGDGGDDEIIRVDLDRLPPNIHHMVVSASIFSCSLSFEDVNSAYFSMVCERPRLEDTELCRLILSEMSGQTVVMGQLTKKGAYWNLRALGRSFDCRIASKLLQDAEFLGRIKNVPSFNPLLRRITITVCKGRHLAPKDDAGLFRREASSDPYYKIKYKKHRFKSERVNRSLNPQWKPAAFDLGAVMESERKPVRISVFDYDMLSSDDFMGEVKVAAGDLFQLGPGEHYYSFDLSVSKKKGFIQEDVSGYICMKISIVDITTPESSIANLIT